MATSVNIGDLLEIKTFCVHAEQVGLNVHHYIVENITGSVTDYEVATAFDSAVSLLLRSMMASDSEYAGTTCQILNGSPPPVPVFSVGSAGAGTLGSVSLPTQTCGLITFTSQLIGRANRGRRYIAFPAADALDTDGTPIAAQVSNLDSLATVLLSVFPIVGGSGTISATLCIGRKPSLTFTRLTGKRVLKRWATQRRRGNFGAANKLPF